MRLILSLLCPLLVTFAAIADDDVETASVAKSADIAAANTNYVFYASGNKAALDQIDPAIKNDPAIYPTPDVAAKLFNLKAHAPRFDRDLTRSWTRIKTGQ